jgi:hypothetical protein
MSKTRGTPVYVVGDVHGHLKQLVRLLRKAGLINRRRQWRGQDAILIFLGDFVDRGPDGIGVIELVMSLQKQAPTNVTALLGNHDLLLMAARRFGDQRTQFGNTFVQAWRANGGKSSDLRRMKKRHMKWLCRQSALHAVNGTLLLHADNHLYTRYGSTVAGVNEVFTAILNGSSAAEWDHLLDGFSHHRIFWQFPNTLPDFLTHFGAQRLVHGHSPISRFVGKRAGDIRQALIYADGQATNVDGGIYLGGPGFIHRLS